MNRGGAEDAEQSKKKKKKKKKKAGCDTGVLSTPYLRVLCASAVIHPQDMK
jgi:hypothetical protein